MILFSDLQAEADRIQLENDIRVFEVFRACEQSIVRTVLHLQRDNDRANGYYVRGCIARYKRWRRSQAAKGKTERQISRLRQKLTA